MFETVPKGVALSNSALLTPLWISVHVWPCFRAGYFSFVTTTRYVEQVLFTIGKKLPWNTSKYSRDGQGRKHVLEKQGKTDLDVGLSFASRNDVCVYLQEGNWCSVTSGHCWFVLRLGDNSNINTGKPLKTPKKTGIYRQTVCVYLNLSSNRHWRT